MSHHVPFHRDPFKPRSIPGNDTAEAPVVFDLSMVGGPDRVRLKGLLYAISGLASFHDWQPDIQAQVIDGFRQAPQIFAHGIDAIHGLTIATGLAKKIGLVETIPDGTSLDTPFPVTTGAQFAALAPYQIVLAMEVAVQISKLSDDGEVDPRFFPWPGTSSGNSASPRGTAPRAARRRAARATAAAASKAR